MVEELLDVLLTAVNLDEMKKSMRTKWFLILVLASVAASLYIYSRTWKLEDLILSLFLTTTIIIGFLYLYSSLKIEKHNKSRSS